jgi:hypothetical protein
MAPHSGGFLAFIDGRTLVVESQLIWYLLDFYLYLVYLL